jgi:hypothetical protein
MLEKIPNEVNKSKISKKITINCFITPFIKKGTITDSCKIPIIRILLTSTYTPITFKTKKQGYFKKTLQIHFLPSLYMVTSARAVTLVHWLIRK